MAIKGKSKTRGRRAVPRPPRREPVPIRPPFFLRRRVQVIGSFVLGILVMVLFIWVTNGLRDQRERNDADEAAASRRQVTIQWRQTLEGELGKLGTISPGAAPTLFTDLSTAIQGLADGKVPPKIDGTASKAADQAASAADAVGGFDLVSKISGHGFNVTQTNYLLNSQTKIVDALKLFAHAARLAQRAAVEGSEKAIAALGTQASDLQQLAQQILADGWSDYEQALFDAGLSQVPQAPTATGPAGGS
jgi:hypothetical protein